ncbi:RNA polymerase II assembly factor Rtp1p [[Candida] anglica]|uniref:RNA polymerase II assembly factor Rtp1p n=1 Tax=[Candida] anglica TaxID=148631 RepID=A0ABP0E5R0_9ASCO
MPPKIEVLDDVPQEPRKNPFSVKPPKKPTIRRDAKEIDPSYRQRKGLNNPEIASNAPIDVLFADLEKKIMDMALVELTFPVLCARFGVTLTESIDAQRLDLVAKLLDTLTQIQTLSMNQQIGGDSLISIALHDIRTFSTLVNLIIIHGVYPALTKYSIGIPFEQRRLNSFTKGATPIKIVKMESDPEPLLLLLYRKFLEIFQCEGSDVKELLLRGTGFSDFYTITLALMTIPSINSSTKSIVKAQYPQIISIPGTFELFQTLSLLLVSPSPSYFKAFATMQLQVLHFDSPHKDGLLTLVEFVLGLRENEEVNVEKFDHVANVVLSKPKQIPTVQYFQSIGLQMYDLLVNINKPVVNSCICYVLEKLWMRNELVVKDFFLKLIWKNFGNHLESTTNTTTSTIVSEKSLNNNINVLLSLTKNNPSPSLLSASFNPILINLWAYFNYLKRQSKPIGVIKNLLVSYFTIMKQENSDDGLDTITKNILREGGDEWEFSMGPNDMVEIVHKAPQIGSQTNEAKVNTFLSQLDVSIDLFTDLLTDLDDTFVQSVFTKVLKRWLNIDQMATNLVSDDENPFFKLIDLRILEGLGNKFKESLAKTPYDMLEIVDTFLSLYGRNSPQGKQVHDTEVDSDDDSDDESDEGLVEQTIPILLELLSAILSETSSSDLDEPCFKILTKILPRLKLIQTGPSVNAAQSLYERITSLLQNDKQAPKTTKELHAKTLARAITSLNDPLVPIRAHGLHLLRQLITLKSEVISLDFVVNLHLVQLKDPEPFIYLNVIKGLQQLIEWDEATVVPMYVDLYTQKDLDLDERLRIGEVLLRYIQESGELFSGDTSKCVVEGALKLVRRRSEEEEPVDNRLRNSAMSLLGVCCMTNPIGMVDNLRDVLDCAIGILKHETSKDEAIMRRSAIVLIHDLIIGTSNSEVLPFPEEYRKDAWNSLNYVYTTDSDLLVRDQAKSVIDTIDDLVKQSFQQYEMNDQYEKFKII